MCSTGGSLSDICDKHSGQCPCRDNVGGRRCDGVEDGFYVPDVHFLSGEFERRDDLNSLRRHVTGYSGDGFVEVSMNVSDGVYMYKVRSTTTCTSC